MIAARLDADAIALDGEEYAIVSGLLAAADCAALAACYDGGGLFRSRVVMARHGFGQGEYRYFDYPLPDTVAALRAAFWPVLRPVANRWNARLGATDRFPASHEAYLTRCRRAGQTRATPLLLKYGPGDYNCLHQDIYGGHVFPLQLAILLSQPVTDFTGDVAVWGGPARLAFHGVAPLAAGEHPLTGACRINLTFRRAM